MVTKKAATKEDLNTFKEEILHQFRITSEGLRSDVKQVAEGVAVVNERMDRGLEGLKREMQETRQEVLAAIKSTMLSWIDA